MCSSIISDAYPLSPIQQGMVFHALAAPGQGVDIEQMVCTLRESLDTVCLRRAWERIVERHPALRTEFHLQAGEPIQVVADRAQADWEEQDWRKASRSQQEQDLARFLKADRHHGFNLEKAPLMRLSLLRIADEEYHLVWTFHHALLDGRSFPTVLNEAFAFYEAFRAGQDLDLPLPRPYRDYIEWLQTLDHSKAETFWRQELQGLTAPTPLVVDKPKTSSSTDIDLQGDHSIFLDEGTTASLNDLAKQNGLTLNTLIQGAWAILLSRYCGEEDVVFGVVRACRKSTVPGADEMVGMFINTLPLRVHVPPEARLLDWLRKLRARWTAMRDCEHTPLVLIRKWSEIPAGNPLFETILMFETYQLDERLRDQGGHWLNRSFRLYEQTGYPLTLTAYAAAELCLQLEFDRRRFDLPTVVRMVNHFKTILEAMLAEPEARLADLPLMTSEELRELTEWNRTQVDYPRHATVHQLFEAQVDRSPDAIAVVCQGRQLTYRELNICANQLAHYLQTCGAKPEALVGICVERSIEMVIAVLGVLKAGAAYVPLDPAFPKGRMAIILEDSRAEFLVTQLKLISKLPAYAGKAVYVDEPEVTRQSPDNPGKGVLPTNLAYVIFTSGSTGRPKGVQIEHRSLVNFLESMGRKPGLHTDDVLVAVTTLSFDIAGLELFLPLTRGARVVIATRETVVDGRNLAALLESTRATVMQATPSTWRLLLESGWAGRPQMKVLCGGEAMPPELARELIQRCASLWNVYGPTETTVWSTLMEVTSSDASIAIGRPIANTQMYVLDQRLRAVPVGVPGELFIGGDGLARGYLNRPELTREQFILKDETERIYKTGDLCRWRADGSLECLGRNDNQVKIRGHRIELGEIEAILSDHASIRHAVVTAQENGAGDKQLIAYVVGNRETRARHQDLRNFLLERLPEYMVPSAFVMLRKIPLTPNGKVDRKALPMAADLEADQAETWTPPVSEGEQTIARLWGEILGVSKVGRDSNFFDLGGDSLSMIRVRSRLEKVFARELAVVELFRYSTVRSLAEYLAGNRDDAMRVRSPEQIRARKESARRRLERRTLRAS
jgi:amino acid adenylation domain-containing protein